MRPPKLLLNIFPVAIIIWFVHSMSPGEILHSLGFGVGIWLTIIFLSFLSWKRKVAVVILLNFLLLGFFFLSYYLPRFDALDPKGFHFLFLWCLFMIPLFQAILALILNQTLLIVKPGSDFFEHSKPLVNLYLMPVVYIGLMGAIILGLSLRDMGVARFSTGLVAAQFLAWFIVWIALYILGRPRQVDFSAVADYVARGIKEKSLDLRIRQDTVIYGFLALLLISTFFEAYRGLWRLWFLTALWLIFLAACMWRVWGFAFIPGEGPGWRYVELFGDYLKNIRTELSPTKVKNESQFLIFLKNHPIFIIILLLLLIVGLLYYHISPFIFFIILFISALLINYFLKEAFKSRGITLADKIPLSVGMTFIWMSIAMFLLLYLLFFVVKQIIIG